MAADVAFENGDLLAKSEDFDCCIASTAEENADHRKDRENEFWHELTLVTRRNVDPSRRRQG